MAGSVADIVAKWKRNTTQAASTSYREGVQQTSVNPMERAAAAVPLYLQKVQEAVASGKVEQALRDTPKQAWVDGCLNKGAGRIAAGVTQAESVVQQFHTQLKPHTDMVKKAISDMPKGTPEDSEARTIAAQRLMRQFRFVKRRG